jgi:tetratricopeptide (TPR) repeat protein
MRRPQSMPDSNYIDCKKFIVALSSMTILMVAGAARAGTSADALKNAWQAYYDGDFVMVHQIAETGLSTGKDLAVWNEMMALGMPDDPARALVYATKAATLEPMNAHMLATQAYFMSADGKKVNAAAKIILKAEALAPRNGRVRAIAGMVFWRGGKGTAITEFDQALNLAPLDFDVNVFASRYYVQTGLDLNAAKTLTDRLVSRYPRSPFVYHLRAEERRKVSDSEGAVKDYSKAIELKPGYQPSYQGRARMLQFMRRFNEAIADDTFLIKNTNYWGFYSQRAECYEQLHDYDKAIADFSAAIGAMNGGKEGDRVYDLHAQAAYDRYRHPWLKRIALYEKSGQYSRAVSDADIVLKAEPTCEPALSLRQKSLRKLGKYQEALSDLTTLIKIAPAPELYTERAEVYAKLNRTADSKADLDRAKRLENL